MPGIMPFRWFNLYSIPENERNSNLNEMISNKKQVIGTSYFGRVLLSLSLSSNDKPDKCVRSLNTFRNP